MAAEAVAVVEVACKTEMLHQVVAAEVLRIEIEKTFPGGGIDSILDRDGGWKLR